METWNFIWTTNDTYKISGAWSQEQGAVPEEKPSPRGHGGGRGPGIILCLVYSSVLCRTECSQHGKVSIACHSCQTYQQLLLLHGPGNRCHHPGKDAEGQGSWGTSPEQQLGGIRTQTHPFPMKAFAPPGTTLSRLHIKYVSIVLWSQHSCMSRILSPK